MISTTGDIVIPSPPATRIWVNPAVFWQLLVFLGATAIAVAAYPELVRMPLRVLFALISGCVIASLAFAYKTSDRSAWSPSSAYLTVYAVFHFGLVLTYALGVVTADTMDNVSGWLLGGPSAEAAVLSLIGLFSCIVGISIAHLTLRPHATVTPSAESPSSPQERQSWYMALIGMLSVLVGVLWWFKIVLSAGGFALLVGSYDKYWVVVEHSSIGVTWIFVGDGLCLVMAAYRPALRKFAVVAFGAFALQCLFALPLGVRGEIMFAAFGVAVVAVIKGARISGVKTLIGVVIVLLLMSAVKDIRTVGIRDAGVPGVNALDALSEMGSSLRPVVEVLSWEDKGERSIHGSSYVAPFSRMACGILPGHECPPASRDDRLMNVLVSARVGPIGFSVVAEAFRNFGRIGVVLIMMTIGLLLGVLDRVRKGLFTIALLGIVVMEMLYNVRNAFVITPSQLLAGFMLVLVCVVVSSVFGEPGQRSRDR